MDATAHPSRRPRLEVVRPESAVDRERLRRELVACIAAHPGGLAPSMLVPQLAERLGVAPDDIPEADLDGALGILVVTGQIDEERGLLVAVGGTERLTG